MNSLAPLQRGELAGLVCAVDDLVVQREASVRGISVCDEALQAEADQMRRELGLFSGEAFERWLSLLPGISPEDIEALLEKRVRRRLLCPAIADRPAIEAWFHAHAWRYAAVAISRLILQDEGIARELYLLLTEEGEDFAGLAIRYSEDGPIARCGGRAGTLSGAQLGRTLSEQALRARPGEILPACRMDDGRWWVIRIEATSPPVLDDETAQAVAEDLFQSWLRDQQEVLT